MNTEQTPEELDAAIWRHEKAKEALDRILSVVSAFDDSTQHAVTDAATRILRLALKAGQAGPFGLTLAGAQMALDLTPDPRAEHAVADAATRILLPPGVSLQ